MIFSRKELTTKQGFFLTPPKAEETASSRSGFVPGFFCARVYLKFF